MKSKIINGIHLELPVKPLTGAALTRKINRERRSPFHFEIKDFHNKVVSLNRIEFKIMPDRSAEPSTYQYSVMLTMLRKTTNSNSLTIHGDYITEMNIVIKAFNFCMAQR